MTYNIPAFDEEIRCRPFYTHINIYTYLHMNIYKYYRYVFIRIRVVSPQMPSQCCIRHTSVYIHAYHMSYDRICVYSSVSAIISLYRLCADAFPVIGAAYVIPGQRFRRSAVTPQRSHQLPKVRPLRAHWRGAFRFESYNGKKKEIISRYIYMYLYMRSILTSSTSPFLKCLTFQTSKQSSGHHQAVSLHYHSSVTSPLVSSPKAEMSGSMNSSQRTSSSSGGRNMSSSSGRYVALRDMYICI